MKNETQNADSSSTSIVRRISFTAIALMIFTACLSMTTTYWHIKRQLEQEFRADLTEGAKLLASSLVHPLWSFDKANSQTICETFALNQEVVLLSVIASGFEEPVCSITKKSLEEIFIVNEFIVFNEQTIGEVSIGLSSRNFEKSMSSIVMSNMALLIVIAGIVLVSLSWILKQYLARPLSIFSKWTKNLSSGVYLPSLQEVKEQELKPLAKQFKAMADKIAMRELELKKLSLATEQSPASVMITDTNGNVEYINQAFEKYSGYSKRELIGSRNIVLNNELTPKALSDTIWAEISNGRPWSGELRNKRRDGALTWEDTRIAPIKNELGELCHFVIVSEDVTIRKQQEKQIVRQAHYDGLTGLPNRFLCIDRLTCAIKEAERDREGVSVLFLDLDDFKKVNDTLGHATGDELLKLAGKRLNKCLRKSDTVGRLGGDEFIVIAGKLSSAEASSTLAANLIKEFRSPFFLDDREFLLTISIGIASYPEDGKSVSELLKNADTAMYQSKKEGRNTFNFYTRSMNEHISRRLILEQQLRKALERGELEVHYQLIVDSNSGYASGAEALVRWFSPELGSVSPDEFIPIAEQNGLIIPIGMFVLRESILAATQWQSLNECYANFKISVNLSPRQFRTKHLISDIDAVLSEFGVGGGILALEITEGVLMSQHLDVSRVLTQLMERKIELSMDDFGTGYSSLSYLRTFPFSRIKIDRSFIQDLLIDNADYELVVATIQMAKALGLKVIAEGVETSAHFSELRKMGCHYAQGYFFNKPCNYTEFTELLIKRCAESK